MKYLAWLVYCVNCEIENWSFSWINLYHTPQAYFILPNYISRTKCFSQIQKGFISMKKRTIEIFIIFVDMQSSIARYFCYHKIDMFFALLKTRYDINLVAVRQHIEFVSTYRVCKTYRKSRKRFILMRCYATQLRGIRFRCKPVLAKFCNKLQS